MDNQKFEVILNRLLDLSEEKNLSWKKTANDYKFLLVLDDSSIVVSKPPADDYVMFEFKNGKGETVESSVVKYGSSTYNKASSLYKLVHSQVLGAEETIDRILEQLNPDSIAA